MKSVELVCQSVNFDAKSVDRFGFLKIAVYVAILCPGFTMKSVCLSVFFFLPQKKTLLTRISLWAQAIAKILAMVHGQIGTYRFLVLFLILPNPQICK